MFFCFSEAYGFEKCNTNGRTRNIIQVFVKNTEIVNFLQEIRHTYSEDDNLVCFFNSVRIYCKVGEAMDFEPSKLHKNLHKPSHIL